MPFYKGPSASRSATEIIMKVTSMPAYQQSAGHFPLFFENILSATAIVVDDDTGECVRIDKEQSTHLRISWSETQQHT